MNPDKYTAIAIELVDILQRDLPKRPHPKLVVNFVAEAIAAAVETEKAKARIVMPSYDIEDAARKWSTFEPDRIAQHFYEGALWLRTHAKIGWGEK